MIEILLVPIFLASIIWGILVHLIYHILNFVDLRKLNMFTHSHSYNVLLLSVFITPYISLIVKQKLLRDHLIHFYKEEKFLFNLTSQVVILILCLIPGIWGFLDIILLNGYLYEHLGNYIGISFILITLLLNPLPLRIIEFQWQKTMNLHIQNASHNSTYPNIRW